MDIAKEKQSALGAQLADIESQIARVSAIQLHQAESVKAVMDWLADCGQTYADGSDSLRRSLNQACFDGFYLDQTDGTFVAHAERTETFEALQTAEVVATVSEGWPETLFGKQTHDTLRYRVLSRVRGSNVPCLVELVGRYSKLPPLPKLEHSTTVRPTSKGHRVHNARKRLGPDVITQLVADYEAGSPSTELMAKYHLGKGTVLKLLRDHGANVRGQGLTEAGLPEAIQLYQAGHSLKQLGDQFGCDAETVRKALRGASVAMRSARRR